MFFIYQKALQTNNQYTYTKKSKDTVFQSVIKTFGFTFLNPHVYSDTVFFLGNFSKSMDISSKIIFGLGASTASLIFFFILGYGAKAVSKHIDNAYAWKLINIFIIIFMTKPKSQQKWSLATQTMNYPMHPVRLLIILSHSGKKLARQERAVKN